MNDTKRQSLEETGPRVPVHEELDISPTPSKSVHRSKTVRNLGKVRGFFKPKNKESTPPPTQARRMTTNADENGFVTRPVLSTSVSYGAEQQKGSVFEEP